MFVSSLSIELKQLDLSRIAGLGGKVKV